jgi:hypothetical protein
MRNSVVVVVVFVAALVGCTKPNPNVCCATEAQCAELGVDDLRPCDVGQACAPDHACVAAECSVTQDCTSPEAPICSNGLCVGTCTSNDDCAAVIGRPLCSPDGACVGCIDASHCASPTSICDSEEHACRGCERDDECASGVCIEADGVCADEARVIYVTMFGDDGECTRTAPCGTFSFALSKVESSGARDVIHIEGGQYSLGAAAPTISTNVILDGTGTMLTYGSGSPFTLALGVQVTLERLSLQLPSMHAITVATSSSLRLFDVALSNLGTKAISVQGGSLTASRVQLTGGQSGIQHLDSEPSSYLSVEDSELDDLVVSASNSIVVITRSRFFRDSTMIQVTGGMATVTNNLFVQNFELADAIYIEAGSGSVFAFNTVVNTSSVISDGVALYCGPSLDVSSNIFAYGSTNPIDGAACPVRNSLFDTHGAADAVGNLTGDASTFFRDRVGGDYRLSGASPALDVGETGIVETDIEGNPRGTSPDIGAFEAH